jgi:hypothetical protein
MAIFIKPTFKLRVLILALTTATFGNSFLTVSQSLVPMLNPSTLMLLEANTLAEKVFFI